MTAPHDKLQGLKPGDRVRVTFEANVVRPDDGGLWLNRGALDTGEDWWGPKAIADSAFQIERIEPPLAVGDLVTWSDGAEHWRIVAFEGPNAILWGPLSCTTPYAHNRLTDKLERIA